MASNHADRFSKFDVFYTSKIPGFMAWGKTGTALLKRLRSSIAEYFDTLGYEEIRLPSVCEKNLLEKYVGPKKMHLVDVRFDGENNLALAPFSDLLYLDHVMRYFRGQNGEAYPRKVFLWSICYIREQIPDFYNFFEYDKCQAFSLHEMKESAQSVWNELNNNYREFCKRDLNLAPVYGYRPRIYVFPGSKRSFTVELCLDGNAFLTILVSHIMKKQFMTENGFSELRQMTLCSSCFSQKLLVGTLVHHMDEFGLRFPPKLAPTLGIIISPKHMDRADKMSRVVSVRKTKDIKEILINSGAIWALQQVEKLNGDDRWLLLKRGSLHAKPEAYRDLDQAICRTNQYIDEYSDQLYSESERKVKDALKYVATFQDLEEVANGVKEGEKANVCAPCCENISCQKALAEKITWLPKAVFGNRESRQCIVCHQSTPSSLMFERQEIYTSFYIPESE